MTKRQVSVDGEPVSVTPIEFGILKLLTQNAGKVFSMEQIYENVWNEPAYNPENTVAVHIRRIREKIEINPKKSKVFKGGVGELDTKLKSYSGTRWITWAVSSALAVIAAEVTILQAVCW